MPNSVDALWTDVWPDLIASNARSKSAGVHVVGLALNGAANLMPSLLAILYKVLEGIPNALDALLAEMVPVRSASKALFKLSSLQDFVGPSFFGVSMPSRCARCHKVVEGIPNVAEILVNLLIEIVYSHFI